MFEGFTLERVDVGEAVLRVRHGGSGPAVLLLHGHPRTHATWHRVAPLLAGSHTVVCPDLRGYGESSKPPTTPDHAPYSKRAMAADCLALMAALGHERFAVVGHDRGAYVALRTALDHPAAVTALAVLDAVPIGEALAPGRRPLRGRLVALVLLRPDGQAGRAGDQRRPRRLVPDRPRADGGGGLRRLPAGHPRPGDRPRHDGGLPRRPRPRPRPRRRRPARRPPGRLPHPGPVGHRRRPGRPVRRRPRRLAPLGGRPPRPPLPLRPPHGRGGPRRPGRRAARLPGRRLGAASAARPGAAGGGRRRRCPSRAWARSATGSSPR